MKLKIQQRENKNVPTEESNKKRKMVFDFDINSDSSETTDRSICHVLKEIITSF